MWRDKSNRDSKTNRSNDKAEERRKGKATEGSRWDTIPPLTRGTRGGTRGYTTAKVRED